MEVIIVVMAAQVVVLVEEVLTFSIKAKLIKELLMQEMDV